MTSMFNNWCYIIEFYDFFQILLKKCNGLFSSVICLLLEKKEKNLNWIPTSNICIFLEYIIMTIIVFCLKNDIEMLKYFVTPLNVYIHVNLINNACR
jgi:hypothetical protein